MWPLTAVCTSRPLAGLADGGVRFRGLSLRSDGVAVDPQLPTNWSSLASAFSGVAEGQQSGSTRPSNA